VIRHLDEETINAVADVLEELPTTNRYEHLKSHLIKRFTDSKEKQLRTLLLGVELGDKRPTQLLRDMKALAGSDATEGLLRTLWLQRLPTRIQQLLLIFEDTTLDKLAECADKLWEHPSSQEVQAVTTAPTTGATVQAIDPVDTITKRLDELALQVASLTYKTRRRGTERQRGRSRSRERSTSRARSSEKSDHGLCYYHRRFGDAARRCTIPCKAQKAIESENQKSQSR